MARTRSNSSSGGASSPARKRPKGRVTTNVLRPSPALVSWIDRAVQRITTEPPWTYQEEAPVGAREHQTSPARELPPARMAQTPDAVPAEVRERFVRVGRDYYFGSGARAFRDHGSKVVTQSENAEVIRSLVQIAQARSWQDITVTGTERFRREAWRIATVSGLVVRGYRPSALEKQRFVRELASARAPRRVPEPLIDPPGRANDGAQKGREEQDAPRPPPDKSARRRASRSASGSPADAREPASARPSPVQDSERRGRAYSGVLIEHGAAPYGFQEDAEPSYFVRLETSRGPKVLWGVDFERALHQAQVKPGDAIDVRQAGRERVNVKRRERDDAGRVVDEREVPVHRNQWEVRRHDARGEEPPARGDALRSPAADVRGAARDDPALAGALLALRGAQVFADQQIRGSEQRAAFVNAVREELARVLDRDGTAPAPLLRERTPVRAHGEAKTLS